MAGKIPEHFIQDVLSRTDIVDLIEARVPLKRSGGDNFVARCPFHNEKTPSFSVSRRKQFYYCFGCGAKGTAISFLIEHDRLTFPEAIEQLADSLGLEVPREQSLSGSQAASEDLAPLYSLLDQAARFYQQQLRTHPESQSAVDYLKSRGVSGELAHRFRLGYAPKTLEASPKAWTKLLLRRAGLVTDANAGQERPWFRDRIVFPIRDRRGRCVGFGGRVLGEGMPKYLNSPETAVFKKHREVYGLFELLEVIRKPADILIVEGYMDVIALAQFQIVNVVATLGTSTSGDQVGLLFRHAAILTFCFDGDAAGKKAAWRALEAGLSHLREGREMRFLLLPDGHDPDSLVREEGAEAFRQRVSGAMTFSAYFFQTLQEGLTLSSVEGRATFLSRANPLIDRIPEGIFKDMLVDQLEKMTGKSLPVQDLRASREKVRALGVGRRDAPSALRTFLALLVQNPELVDRLDSATIALLREMPRQGALIGRIIDYLLDTPQATPAGLLEAFRGSPEATVVERLMAWDTQVGESSLFESFEDHLEFLVLKKPRASRLEFLIAKAGEGALSVEEKEELRRLTLGVP